MKSYMTPVALPDSFYWSPESWGLALRCRPLEPVAPHLFTTRQLALSSHSDWASVAEALGAREIASLTQVHGREVVVIRRREGLPGARAADDAPSGVTQRFGGADRPEADALVSDDSRVALSVRAADCVPLLLGDRVTGSVAAIHAGWRGTAAGAARAAVEALGREFGVRADDLVAAVGPSIGACCYEVGPELVEAFLAAGHAREDVEQWFSMVPGAARPRLDTWAANRDQLRHAGMRAENIHVAGLCTACHLDLFPSFRKEREGAGRMVGAIRARGR